MRDLVVAGGNLLCAAREFPAGQRFQHKRCDQPVTEQGDFFGFGIHEEDLLSQKHKAKGIAGSMQKLCGALRREAPPGGARHNARPELETPASPTGGIANRRTGNGERRSSRWTATCPGLGGRRSALPLELSTTSTPRRG